MSPGRRVEQTLGGLVGAKVVGDMVVGDAVVDCKRHPAIVATTASDNRRSIIRGTSKY